jgi:hypothetical protein
LPLMMDDRVRERRDATASAEGALRAAIGILQREGAQLFAPGPRVVAKRFALTRLRGPELSGWAREQLRGGSVVLGTLYGGHLGDCICTTSLPRKLVETYGCKVYVQRHRSVGHVLANNPFVAGTTRRPGLHLGQCAKRQGHIIHRLEAALGLRLEDTPRGELYLSSDESEWAGMVRRSLPVEKPIAVLVSGSLSDGKLGRRPFGSWQKWCDILSEHYTVVQLALTDPAALAAAVPLRRRRLSQWRPDPILRGCVVLENLPVRQFIAIFSVASLFVGCNTGGAHIAAAFGVTGLIALPQQQYSRGKLFGRLAFGNHSAAFLYPQHMFVFV